MLMVVSPHDPCILIEIVQLIDKVPEAWDNMLTEEPEEEYLNDLPRLEIQSEVIDEPL